MELDDLIAESSIRRSIYRYCRGVDRGDIDMIASAYHDDADENHGAFKGTGREFAEYLVPLMDIAPESSGHHVTNILIDRDGDVAHVESYFIAFHAQDEGGRAFVTGRYLDRFALRNGDWKIDQRQVIIDSDSPATMSMDLSAYPRGARRSDDLSHGWIR
ncbi:MAG: nuclear transport factor 2 family protein [Altererythrobacter sp. XM-24bin4]|uniref:nuclear transport factor 2 family protein n=1 Tax=uncultured Altererythrobacter sp. TaxID=500840 RepID=UPI000D799C6E|nr:nuclear transport factor 2 family protein [uncultured Altererythrobacter sp.]PWL25160.1 MAG: nuclear transport factor 2 family protein [Altererythrobacter sp. XM-24bin4]